MEPLTQIWTLDKVSKSPVLRLSAYVLRTDHLVQPPFRREVPDYYRGNRRIMRLIDLNPQWVGAGGEGITRNGESVPRREGVGVAFDCPCGCDQQCFVPFNNPLDGSSAYVEDGRHLWQRTGETFEVLTLTPSILRVGGCGWHGFITNGEIITC